MVFNPVLQLGSAIVVFVLLGLVLLGVTRDKVPVESDVRDHYSGVDRTMARPPSDEPPEDFTLPSPSEAFTLPVGENVVEIGARVSRGVRKVEVRHGEKVVLQVERVVQQHSYMSELNDLSGTSISAMARLDVPPEGLDLVVKGERWYAPKNVAVPADNQELLVSLSVGDQVVELRGDELGGREVVFVIPVEVEKSAP